MIKGELDNTSPPRWLITLDVLTDDHGIPKKQWRESLNAQVERIELNTLVKGALLQVTSPSVFELLVFRQTLDFTLAVADRLERDGWPIAWTSAWPTISQFQQSLAYRPEVQYIIDIPERLLMWGARGITLREVRTLHG